MVKHGGGNGWDEDDIREFAGKARDNVQRYFRWVIVAIIGASLLGTAYYQVEPEEVGVVTRFGQYKHTTEPGPHLKIPFGIDQVMKVPVQRQLKEEFGFRTVSAGVRSEFASTDESSREASMLTGDLNVANVEWIVQFKIRDPYKFLFKVRHVSATFRDMAEAAMRQVVGDHSVTEVLTIGREAVQRDAKDRLQELADKYEIGIEVLQLVLQDVNPPAPVRPSFNEVNQAQQEMEKSINQAEAEYNKVIPRARGEARQVIQSAKGYESERVNNAHGDAERFRAVQIEYAKAPQVTRTRLYLETLAKVLPKAGKRFVIDEQTRGLLPLLPLGSVK